MPPVSLYLHIPFCAHRCAYCDFNTYAGQERAIPAYVAALVNEIQAVGGMDSAREAHTVFFGGGTPSLLTDAQFADILNTIRANFNLLPDAEVTFEANPGTVSADGLQALRAAGLNRISYGVQSANPGELRLLERIHTYADVVDAVRWSRRAGFDNLNLDLIYGLPEQTLESWQQTVKLAAGLGPQHLSMYALTLEHGTPFGRWAQKGLLPIPDPDLAAEMAAWAADYLTAQGYEHYEISNWALAGRECRHNLQYWRNWDYLGLGAGAHGYAGGVRYSNVLRIKTYIDRLALPTSTLAYPLSPATVNHHRNSPREDMQETMMTSLRLLDEGVRDADFRARFGMGIADAFPKEVNKLLARGLLEWADFSPGPFAGEGAGVRALRLTPPAWLVANQVFVEFVD